MRLSTDLDGIDLKLLQLLQENGRAGLAAMAEEVGLSSPAVAERLRKLEERGVLQGYSARLSAAALALDIAAFIQVRINSSTHYPKFLARATLHPEIMECHAVTGEASHLLKIRTRNTETLEKLLAEIQKWPGVVGTRTNLVLSTHKETLALPFAHAEQVVAEKSSAREGRRERNGQM